MKEKKRYIDIEGEFLRRIGAIADRESLETYVVGGYVRDKLLGKKDADIDVVVVGDAVVFAKIVAKELKLGNVVVYEKFGTAMLPVDGGKVEFVTAREEQYDRDSRKPSVRKASLRSDLSRRDFTINALAACLNSDRWGALEDPYDGEADLSKKLIRTPLDPDRTFDDDPLRILRAIRFASQLQFQIDEETLRAIRSMRDRLRIVSQERIADEFLKILASPEPSVGLALLYETGVADIMFPELSALAGVEQRKDYHHKDVFLHTLQVVDTISASTENVWLRFVGLVHDIAKPRTKAFIEGAGWTFHGHEEIGARMMKGIFRRMRLPTEHLPYVEKLVRLHLRPMVLVDDGVTDSAVRRLLFEAGNDVDDLMLLCRADITTKNPSRGARYSKNYDIVVDKLKEVEEKDRLRNWQPPVRGDEIMKICGLEPGPMVGTLKKKIEEAILEGDIPNEHDAALQYLLRIKDSVMHEGET